MAPENSLLQAGTFPNAGTDTPNMVGGGLPVDLPEKTGLRLADGSNVWREDIRALRLALRRYPALKVDYGEFFPENHLDAEVAT